MLDQALKHTAVLGAAGKMGSGISLLLLQEMALLQAQGHGQYSLVLIDSNEGELRNLKNYLRKHLRRFAERNINDLRHYYHDNSSLISNEEIIDYFVNEALDMTRFDSMIEEAHRCTLIFEAIVENVDIKTDVFKTLTALSGQDSFYFTNTSSIPISVLSEQAQLGGKLIGYHFYNPPAIQKLLEIITTSATEPALKEMSDELAARLKKTVVYSKDVAGFIGNGHFIPEAIFACKQVQALVNEGHALHEAIYIIDSITRNYLIRPMGIFQLIDYVGIDVAEKILSIMKRYLQDNSYHDPLIDSMTQQKIYGGQNSDGTQKEGFFCYTGMQPNGIYHFTEKRYISFDEGRWKQDCDQFLSPLPKGHATWKDLQKSQSQDEKLNNYFSHLFNDETPSALLAQKFLYHSRDVAEKLVNNDVANSMADVTTVLTTGFYHLYGPDAPWIPNQQAIRSKP
ncbi:MAG: 3-hydroxyacyl-CoA dehydrogenase family protein [Chlamydiia bacterium]|nr:3-hydroxyacyl-CoA dehydrogenase family protein [Chlamydiia bacterium]